MQAFPYGRVRITHPDLSCFGLTGTVEMVYYDRQHTGSSPDMLYILLDDGRQCRVLSTGIEQLGEPDRAPKS